MKCHHCSNINNNLSASDNGDQLPHIISFVALFIPLRDKLSTNLGLILNFFWSEVEQGWAVEPMKRMRAYLQHLKLWDETQEVAYRQECTQLIEEGVNEYFATTKPPVTAMFDHLYANPPKRLLDQREEAVQLRGATSIHG